MLWSEQTWQNLWTRMIEVAKKSARNEAEAEDMAAEATLSLLEHLDDVEVSEKAYLWGALRNIMKKPGKKIRSREPIPAVPYKEQELPDHERDDSAKWMLESAAALQQVLAFGRQQKRGTTTLLLRASRIDLTSSEMTFRYIFRVLKTAPVDPKTRRKGLTLFWQLMKRAAERVTVDTEHMPDARDAFELRPEAWIGEEHDLRELSGDAADAAKLLRLLFPRMPEPVAMDHAVKVEAEVWKDRDRGVSHYMFLHHDEHPPEEADHDGLVEQLKRLWKWEDGDKLVLTARCAGVDVAIKLIARDKAFLVEAPTGEQVFGASLPGVAEEVLLEALEYDPPDEEVDAYYTILEPEKPDHMEGVAEFLLSTLEYCYGWNPDDSIGWECTYDSWEDASA